MSADAACSLYAFLGGFKKRRDLVCYRAILVEAERSNRGDGGYLAGGACCESCLAPALRPTHVKFGVCQDSAQRE